MIAAVIQFDTVTERRAAVVVYPHVSQQEMGVVGTRSDLGCVTDQGITQKCIT